MSRHPLFESEAPVLIGMLHMPALPGSPRFDGNWRSVRDLVLQDAESLISGGISNLMLENFGDVPFFPKSVPASTVAAMTAIACELKARFADTSLGINVLRNDGCSALSIAQAAGGSFVRVNVLCGARVTDQGIIEGIAHELMRLKAGLRATGIAVLADVDVKHSGPLAERNHGDEVRDAIERGLADAIVVSGAATGSAVCERRLAETFEAAAGIPVLIGSGATAETIPQLARYADGMIIGTAVKHDGCVAAPIDPERVRKLVEAAASAPRRPSRLPG
jgi:uncharacterized protein